jgi:hypothetical protein
LWDLKKGLPSQIDICDSLIFTDFKINIPHGQKYTYYEEDVDVEFYPNSLFDTLHLSTKIKLDPVSKQTIYCIGDASKYPIRSYFKVALKPNSTITNELSGAQIYEINKDGYSFVGGKWVSNRIEFYTNSLGNYTLLTDSIPPIIIPVTLNTNQIKFVIKDKLSGIKDFKVFVNNEWLLMDYDYKTNTIWSIGDIIKIEPNSLIRVELEDNAGLTNSQIFTVKL